MRKKLYLTDIEIVIIKGGFKPLSGMSELYPILRKLPVLLPVMWIVRCFHVVPYWQHWQEQWHELDIDKIRETWSRQ